MQPKAWQIKCEPKNLNIFRILFLSEGKRIEHYIMKTIITASSYVCCILLYKVLVSLMKMNLVCILYLVVTHFPIYCVYVAWKIVTCCTCVKYNLIHLRSTHTHARTRIHTQSYCYGYLAKLH